MTQLQRLTIAASQMVGAQILLTDSQQHYLHRVLRLGAGDRFIAIDGTSNWWLAELQADPALATVLEAIAAQTEISIPLTLLIALPKTGMDDVVRQATELGVQQIVPILSQRTVLNPSSQKLERWQRIAQEAAEQSERQLIPTLQLPQAWPVALQNWNQTQGKCYLCEARGDHPHLLKLLWSDRPQTRSDQVPILIAVGPEGGWTADEIEQARIAGYQPVSLGARVLRAVTAPLVALSLIAAVNEVGSPDSPTDGPTDGPTDRKPLS